jgi:ubiquinone/menaquinone biosynthesis C-methylase UbiE
VPTQDELKEQQRRQWSGNAPNWDSMHERLRREMAEVTVWLCREARLAPGMRVLDLACGSGHPALDIARLVAPGGSVVATDLVEEMVEATRRRAEEAGLDNLEVRVMDAEAIDYPEASFDAVTCRFGLMFCPNAALTAREVHRVLRPGGRFALSVWDMPERSPGQTVLGEALRRFGRPNPATDFSAPGIYQMAPPGKLEALLEEAGFADVQIESMPLDFEYESLEALWERTMARPGPQRAIAQELSAEEVRRLKVELAQVVRPYTREGVIHLPTTPLCAVAAK